MTAIAKAARSPIIPTLRYRDVEAAVSWLGTAFGFQLVDETRAPGGLLVSAQMSCGAGLVMLAAVGQSVFDDLMTQPDEIGGAETQSCYFIIADCDAHYARARASGAQIVLEIQEFENGGRGYMCRDPEHHLWSFGTYDPWHATQQPGGRKGRMWPLAIAEKARASAAVLDPRRRLALAALAAVAIIAAGTAASMTWQTTPSEPAGTVPRISAITLFKERGARLAAQREAGASSADLTRLREQNERLELDLAKLQEELDHVAGSKDGSERARQAAEQSTAKLNSEMSRLQTVLEQAQKASRIAIAKSLRDRQARQKTRRQTEELRQQVAVERESRQRSETAARELKADIDREVAAADAADKDRLKVQELLVKEREAKTKLEESLRQAQEQLAKAEAAPTEPADGSPTTGTLPETKSFTPPRPAKRPEKRRRN